MSDFSVKQFANSPRVNQILHRVNSLICTHTKNCNHLRSHWRDIMALDYSRLGLENKFLENKSGRIFCVRQVYLPTNLGACKPTFYAFYTSHLRWNSTLRRCFYHTDLEQNAVFHNFAKQILLIKYSGRWKHTWAFSEIVKKIFKITYTASRLSLLTTAKWMNNYRVTLKHNKEFIMFIFYLMVSWRCVIFKSVWCARHFEYPCKRCSWTTENKRHSD